MKLFKIILVLIGLSTVLYSCKNEELENKIKELEQQNQELSMVKGDQSELINDYIKSINEIEESLAEIKDKEDIITTNLNNGDGDIQETAKDQIVNDIGLINELLQKNKAKISALNSKLKSSNLKVDELEKLVARLANQIQSKDAQIAQLQTDLASANEQLKLLFEEYNNRVQELDETTNELNTAYYCYGSSKELLENGIITKEGGFIGLGKISKLKDDFNKDYFTQVDVTTINEIELLSKKAKVVTSHPSTSYEIVGEDERADKIVIKDANAFWASSKYLVIIVE